MQAQVSIIIIIIIHRYGYIHIYACKDVCMYIQSDCITMEAIRFSDTLTLVVGTHSFLANIPNNSFFFFHFFTAALMIANERHRRLKPFTRIIIIIIITRRTKQELFPHCRIVRYIYYTLYCNYLYVYINAMYNNYNIIATGTCRLQQQSRSDSQLIINRKLYREISALWPNTCAVHIIVCDCFILLSGNYFVALVHNNVTHRMYISYNCLFSRDTY